jgi:CDP-paratose 2-epimerase
MDIVLVTGSSGLIGGEAVDYFSQKKFKVIGIDNDMRSKFFGKEASTKWNEERLKTKYPEYVNYNIDIRDEKEVENIFSKYGNDIKLIIHTAAQPSHDWAAKEPLTDYTVNANGTLILLEATRKYCQGAVFIFTSTNKVYGDTPNKLPLEELETRWEIAKTHKYFEKGIDENMSIDNCTHSLFGVSKASADLLVQEYGRYFGIKTACFRGGCLTGPSHSGAMLHGFLSYLVNCAVLNKKYFVYGYKAKQVRDNIHSYDLVNAFYHFFKNPKVGEVYNIGGSRHSNCSMMEAISICDKLTNSKLDWKYKEANRIGDHIWWISDVSKFKSHYPDWEYKYNLEEIIKEIVEIQSNRIKA